MSRATEAASQFLRALAELPASPTIAAQVRIWTLKRVAFIDAAIEHEREGNHAQAKVCADAALEARRKVEELERITEGVCL